MRDEYSGNLGQVDQFAGPLLQRGLRILSIFVARMKRININVQFESLCDNSYPVLGV